MEYKKIIKSKKTRSTILSLLSFIPDRIMLQLQYKIKFDRSLNLKNPIRYTEKIQWYKLNYRDPVMPQCVDKYTVRDYVKRKGLERILIPLYVHVNNINEIEWNKLPNEFVIKSTNGGGGLNVIICRDKSTFDIDKAIFKLKNKKQKAHTGGREWAYYGLEPSIIVEKLLVNEENPESSVEDFKFYCFSGEPKYVHVDLDRYTSHKRNFYDIQWNLLTLESEYPNAKRVIDKPKNFNEMLQVARTLSEDFPFVRVDLYNIRGKIYFGEMTFYPSSGYAPHNPDEWDYTFGKNFELRSYINKE